MSRGSSGDIVASSSHDDAMTSDDDGMTSDGDDTDNESAAVSSSDESESDGASNNEAAQRRAAVSHRARSLQRLGVRAGTAFHSMLADSRLAPLCCCWAGVGTQGWGYRDTHGLPTSTVVNRSYCLASITSLVLSY